MGEDSEEEARVDSGGEPHAIGRCTACGTVYPVQAGNGALRPVGTEGTCECGNDEFEVLSVP